MLLRITVFAAIFLTSFHPLTFSQPASALSLTVASSPWSLTFPGIGFQLMQQQIKPDGKHAYYVFGDDKTMLTASVFIEPAVKCTDSKSCRDMVWKAGNPSWQNLQNVSQSEINGISVFEFMMPVFNGRTVNQYHLYAEYVVDGFWVDLHISKVMYKPTDHQLFERVLQAVHFAKPKDPKSIGAQKPPEISEETVRYARQGSQGYLQRDYKTAIKHYSKVLELEKKNPTLPPTIWRVVVDNLGMSYGISGDNAKAKEVFEYGLSKDATYPMFYYNLACAYAEMGEPDNALKNLRLAYKYRSNLLAGEVLPDPANDNSFARYLKDEKFRAALKELGAK
jgi:tetratricopeptide (TPR) repeat protein